MNKNIVALCLASILGFSGSVYATNDNAHVNHSNMKNETEMQKELMESMNKMHKKMSEGLKSTDADKAFAEGMIAHHEGAIDMAKIELKYGKDPEMRKLAEAIIKAQGPEIEQMKKWLGK